MLRIIYSALLSLHPAAFRERFASEMLSIFDLSSAHAALVADAALSLARQWTLRREFHTPELAPVPVPGSLFQFPDEASRSPILVGLFPALGSFALISFLIASGGISGEYVIGSQRADRAGFHMAAQPAQADLDTEVTATPTDILDTFKGREMVRGFYRMIPALRSIDANYDLVLSREEIANAPQALHLLDRNHDSSLDARECGWPGNLPYWQLPGEEDVMRSNPVLAALDINHDGRISAEEIESSPSTLKQLDRDRNGRLTPDEVLSTGQRKRMEEFLNAKP